MVPEIETGIPSSFVIVPIPGAPTVATAPLLNPFAEHHGESFGRFNRQVLINKDRDLLGCFRRQEHKCSRQYLVVITWGRCRCRTAASTSVSRLPGDSRVERGGTRLRDSEDKRRLLTRCVTFRQSYAIDRKAKCIIVNDRSNTCGLKERRRIGTSGRTQNRREVLVSFEVIVPQSH